MDVSSGFGDRLYALLEIMLCAGLVTSQLAQLFFETLGFKVAALLASPKLITAFLMVESTLMLGLILFLQKLRSTSLWDLGIAARCLFREAQIGLAIVPLLFVTNFLIASFFKSYLPQWHSENNPLLELIKTPTDLGLFVIASLFAGGIKEEIQRAFILQRFKRCFSAAVVGLILWSVAFGAGHIVQGVDNACVAAVFSIFLGALYFRRGCLIAPVVAHAAYDVVVLAIYWFLGVH
jgi:membrane protease YdiL (CAAX protease family)